MKTTRLPFALVLFAPLAVAQDGQPPMPDANDPAYAPLKSFVGSWDLTVKITGAPQVGGTETFESICNGLFLKSVVHSTYMGQPFQGVSLWGYDPKLKKYVNIWADSHSATAVRTHSTFDPATKTWTHTTIEGKGPTRSVLTWKDDNNFQEIAYGPGPDGKETVVMELLRTRGKPGSKPATSPASTPLTEGKVPADKITEKAAAHAAAALSAGHKDLHRAVGKWTLTQKMVTPDGSAHDAQGTEVNSAACNGLWVWTDFSSTMGGGFEGHGLVGFDPDTKTYTTYWVDSWTPTVTVLAGKMDDKTKALTLSGVTTNAAGEESAMQETTVWQDEHTRTANFTFGAGPEAVQMELAYKRAQQDGAHMIK
jgi:hypothetical protein